MIYQSRVKEVLIFAIAITLLYMHGLGNLETGLEIFDGVIYNPNNIFLIYANILIFSSLDLEEIYLKDMTLSRFKNRGKFCIYQYMHRLLFVFCLLLGAFIYLYFLVFLSQTKVEIGIIILNFIPLFVYLFSLEINRFTISILLEEKPYIVLINFIINISMLLINYINFEFIDMNKLIIIVSIIMTLLNLILVPKIMNRDFIGRLR